VPTLNIRDADYLNAVRLIGVRAGNLSVLTRKTIFARSLIHSLIKWIH